jgi:hypothetical protein
VEKEDKPIANVEKAVDNVLKLLVRESIVLGR